MPLAQYIYIRARSIYCAFSPEDHGDHTQSVLLADRTNGRAYATVLRLSVCRLSSVCRL